MALRTFTLEETEDGGWRRWRLSSQHTGEIRECASAEQLLATLFGDLADKPGIVALAEWLTQEVASMDQTLVDAEL